MICPKSQTLDLNNKIQCIEKFVGFFEHLFIVKIQFFQKYSPFNSI
jgi:hypothetical protein